MTTTEPVPNLDIETVPAALLETGIVLPRRQPGNSRTAVFKTIEHVRPSTRAHRPYIEVTYTDGTTNKWPRETRVVAVADSLPASYWRVKCATLQATLDRLAKDWHRTAIRLGQPDPTSAESPAVRDGRARQARMCANTVTALIARPGTVTR